MPTLMPQLRPATEADYDAVLALNHAFVRFLSPLTRDKLARLAGEAAYFKVADADGEVAAFLLGFREGAAYESENYRWFAGRYASFLYVDRIVVAQAHHGSGVGAALYRDFFAMARALGAPWVTCEIDFDPPNAVSERFHQRFGFREVGQQRVSYGGNKAVSLQAAPASPAPQEPGP